MSAPEDNPPPKPPRVVDEDVVHVPTKRRAALPGRMLAKDLTVAEAKSLLDADTDRLEPKADGRKRTPVSGYSDEERRAAYKRVSKAARMQPANLRKNRSERVDATKAEKQRWNRMAKPLWPGRYKDQVVDIMVERTGAKDSTMYRALKRPQ